VTPGQRLIRVVTSLLVRRPEAWRLLRGPLRWEFDRLAPTWEGRMDPERLRPIRAALAALPAAPARVLDLGTGTGRVARLAAELWPDAEVTGADVSPAMIDEARTLGGRARYDVADSAALPYPDGAFDLVTLNNMIPFFDELARVTAPGGHVAIAFSMGARTPIYVPLDRVRAELERRGFTHVANFPDGGGAALLANKAGPS
jgi:SAM-dependent methyltransferase